MHCGMVTPTLSDMDAIMGLRPTGKNFDPTFLTSTKPVFDFDHTTYEHFIEDFYETDSEVFSDREHLTFLIYWLSRFVFGYGSLQVAKKFLTLATQIPEG